MQPQAVSLSTYSGSPDMLFLIPMHSCSLARDRPREDPTRS